MNTPKTTTDYIAEHGAPVGMFRSDDWNVRERILNSNPKWANDVTCSNAVRLLNDLACFEGDYFRGEQKWVEVCEDRWAKLLALFGYDTAPEYWNI